MADFASTMTELELTALVFNAVLLAGIVIAVVFADAINRLGKRLYGVSAKGAFFPLPQHDSAR